MTDRPSPLSTPIRGAVPATITLFGDNDHVDHALSEELGRRGCRTHAVSVETGWLRSARNVIARLDTNAGQRAIEGLVSGGQPRARVVAVCEQPADEQESLRLQKLCQECGRHHDVSLIWHSAVPDVTNGEPRPADQLAVSVVDEVSTKINDGDDSPFTARFVDLG